MIKFIEIKTIEYINDLQYVNDITVENNHNYFANDYLVHNCITTSNVSIHYPQATLIDETYKIKKEIQSKRKIYEYDFELPKIIADGGIRNFDHVNIALGLGADYVMIGSLFAQCIESAGEKISKNIGEKLKLNFNPQNYISYEYDEYKHWWGYYSQEKIDKLIKPWKECLDNSSDKEDAQKKYDERLKSLKEHKFIGDIDVKFFGMASADGQKSISGKKTKTAEGITKYLPVIYTLKGWCKNMRWYLASAMSYTDCHTLNDYIGNIDFIINSNSEIKAVNK